MDNIERRPEAGLTKQGRMDRGVAIVLNSSYCGFYAHAGFLAQITELFGNPAQISGSSAGALVAGLYAGGMSFDEIFPLLLEAKWGRIFHEWVTPLRATSMLFNRDGITGAIRSHRAVDLLSRHLKKNRIEECVAPSLSIAVTNLTAARAEIVREGPLAEMIVASCCYPGLFAAYEVAGQKLWDGGIANPAPVEQWIDDPQIHTVIAHFVSNDGEHRARQSGDKMNIFNAVGLSHQIIGEEIFRLQAELLRHAGKKLVCLSTVTVRPGLSKPQLGPSLVACGRATVRENISLLESLFDAAPPLN